MAGLGSMPSSRITKLLQEKAEQLKRRRQNAEETRKEVDERLELLESAAIDIPESSSRTDALKELERKSDWEGLEREAKAFLEYLQREAGPPFEARRDEVIRRVDRLDELGRPLPPEVRLLLDEAAPLLRDGKWADAFERLAAVDEATRSLESDYQASLHDRILALVSWATGSDSPPPGLEEAVSEPLSQIAGGRVEAGQHALEEVLQSRLPRVGARRLAARSAAEQIIPTARELGVPTASLEAFVEAERRSLPLEWPQTVEALERATGDLVVSVQEKIRSTVDALRETLESLRTQGVDPSDGLATLEEVSAQVSTVAIPELPGLIGRARDAAEGPVVTVVAGILDEVRPHLVEARRLGRDPSDVFAAMNRAREALRLRIYGEAIAASQEALDRVAQLTEDVESARSEAESVLALLEQLATTRFPSATYEGSVVRAQQLLERGDLAAARKLLQDTVTKLGREATAHFQTRLATAERQIAIAQERGFLPADLAQAGRRTRSLLEEGRLGDAGEMLGRIDAGLRSSAGPYLSRRLEQLEHGLSEVPDDALITPVRRLMADADVNLRIKDDLGASLDCLRRAEREFASVFAARASSLVEALAEERRVLEQMGGTGDEIQREIDEVEQIFNMGDFVKASKAAQEIRIRTLQQQLVRSEEAVSHAKLALVELGTMGLDVAALKADLEKAQEASRSGRFAEAFRMAESTTAAARHVKFDGQEILDQVGETEEMLQSLGKTGVPADRFRASIQEARVAYQALDFAQARAVLAQVKDEIGTGQLRIEAERLLDQAKLMLEDARRLSVPLEETADRLATAREQLEKGQLREAYGQVRAAHGELVSALRPALEESLRSLEADTDTARTAGLDVTPALATLNEARRRLAMPAPTGAAELLESARSQFFESRGFLEHAERAQRRATEALNQAELVRVDVEPARAKSQRIQDRISHRDYAKAIDLASSLERELTQATVQQVSRSLASFQGKVARARREGANTTLAENFLAQSKTALENSLAIEALQLAARAESEIERVELQHQVARGSLETMERKLETAQKEGVVAPAAAEQVARARAHLAQHEYIEVLEAALSASDSLALSREYHRRARESIDIAERLRDVAAGLDADVTESAATLDIARKMVLEGDYTDAIRRARDAAEKARWATERLYAGTLEDARRLVELTRAWAPEGVYKVALLLDEAEAALKARDWKRITERLGRARELAEKTLTAAAVSRREAVDQEYARILVTDPGENDRRTEIRRNVEAALSEQRYGSAFEILSDEEKRLGQLRLQELGRRLKDLQDNLLVGEKLGLDTTPVMQLFSEAKLALEAGKPDPVPGLVDRAMKQLSAIVGPRVDEKLREVRSEMVFARDGLNVALGPVGEILDGVPRLVDQGALLDAARSLLSGEEQLNQRKAEHRELMNLQYLVDASLAQAQARHLDTTRARELLSESIAARTTDYGLALEKARQAHELLKSMLKPSEPLAGFWPFRRPPPAGSTGPR